MLLFLLNFAQTGNLKGIVTQKDNTPMINVVVRLWENGLLKYETSSGTDGFYQLNAINTGKYRLVAAFSAKDSFSQIITIQLDSTITKNIQRKISKPTTSSYKKEMVADSTKIVMLAEEVKSDEYTKKNATFNWETERKGAKAAPGMRTKSFSAAPAAPAPSGVTGSIPPSGYESSKMVKVAPISLKESYSAKLEGSGKIMDTKRESRTTSLSAGEAAFDDVGDAEGGGDEWGFGIYGMAESDEIPTGGEADKMEAKGEKIPATKAGTLTAGEVSDFGKWNLWTNIAKNDLETWSKTWATLPENRYTVQLSNEKDYPVVGANVYLTNKKGARIWAAKTDNTGKAELWEGFFTNDSVSEKNPHILISYKGKNYDIKKAKKFHDGINFIKINTPCVEKQIVDIAFVVDATGSMDDEIHYLKTELLDVIEKVKDTLKTADLQLGSVFYRDNGELYLTRETELSTNIEKTVDFIKANGAGGGGDTPEAVDAALEVALHNLKWRENATTKMLFLILDAPPHQDEATQLKIKQLTREAAEKGVRLIPIVCSGADKSTEYLMRTFALASNGTYLFLTNHSGVGGAHIEPTTDKYDVVFFNNLLRNTIVNFAQIQSCEKIEVLAKQDTGKVNEMVNVTVKDSAQTERIEKQPLTWKYYPNPTTGIVKVEVNGEMNELFVADITGKVLQRYERKGEELITVDISEFPNGIYLLRYEYAPDKWMSGKVVLAH